MKVTNYKLIEFEYDGKNPFSDWLETLPPAAQAKILVRLDRVKAGNFGFHKRLSENIYELKFKGSHESGYRIYFGIVDGKIVLLLCGGDKKTQRKKDVKNAEAFWEIFVNSQNEEA